jgi:hypothetical protein
MSRAPWRSAKLSHGPYSVRRMTEHDQWCESAARGVKERLRFLGPIAIGCETAMPFGQKGIA